MKMTPGPWKAEKGNNGITILADNYYGVARTYGNSPQDKANARLIAMAPELLEVLKEFIDNIYVPDANCSCHIAPPCSDCVDHANTRDLLENARAVIAKIEEEKEGE